MTAHALAWGLRDLRVAFYVALLRRKLTYARADTSSDCLLYRWQWMPISRPSAPTATNCRWWRLPSPTATRNWGVAPYRILEQRRRQSGQEIRLAKPKVIIRCVLGIIYLPLTGPAKCSSGTSLAPRLCPIPSSEGRECAVVPCSCADGWQQR